MLNLDMRNGSEGSRYTVFPEGAVAYPSPTARLGREKKRILLVDSQPIFRFGVRTVLEAAGYDVIGEAASAAEAVCAAEKHEPELIILDIDLAQGDAIELVRQLTRLRSTTTVLVLTMFCETLYGARLLAAGASGYLSKRRCGPTLLNCVAHLLNGGLAFGNNVIRGVMLGQRSPSKKQAASFDGLSDREFQIFRTLAEGLTCREVADRMGLSVKTVQTYCDRIKTKMNYHSQQQMVAMAGQFFRPY